MGGGCPEILNFCISSDGIGLKPDRLVAITINVPVEIDNSSVHQSRFMSEEVSSVRREFQCVKSVFTSYQSISEEQCSLNCILYPDFGILFRLHIFFNTITTVQDSILEKDQCVDLLCLCNGNSITFTHNKIGNISIQHHTGVGIEFIGQGIDISCSDGLSSHTIVVDKVEPVPVIAHHLRCDRLTGPFV